MTIIQLRFVKENYPNLYILLKLDKVPYSKYLIDTNKKRSKEIYNLLPEQKNKIFEIIHNK